MAFGAGLAVASGGSSTGNQATIVATLTAQAPTNSLVVAIFALDNFATTNGDEGAISAVTDSTGSNTWSKAVEFCNAAGAASQNGATVSIWFTHILGPIPIGATITAALNNASSRDATAHTVHAFSKGPDSTIVIEKVATLANNASDPGSLTATTINVPCLRIRAIASETNSTTALTVTAGWTALVGNRSGSGAAAANQTVRGEYRISTTTSDASNPTYVAADTASAYVAFREVPRLPAALGNFLLSGKAATLAYKRSFQSAFGSFGLGGQAVALTPTLPAIDHIGVADVPVAAYPVAGIQLVDPILTLVSMSAAAGAFTLGGQPANFRRRYATVGSLGSYSLAGQAVPLDLGTLGLDAVRGIYSLAGQAVGLSYLAAVTDHLGVADAPVAAFPVAGSRFDDPGFLSISAALGTYTLIGGSAFSGYRLDAAAGFFWLSGAASVSQRATRAQVGSYSLVGAASIRTLLANVGTFTLSGKAVGPTLAAPDHLSVADAAVASFPVAGAQLVDPAVAAVFMMPAALGTYTLAGPAVSITHRVRLPIAAGVYAYSGAAVSLRIALPAGVGAFTLGGQAVALRTIGAPLFMPAGLGAFSLAGQAVAIKGLFALPSAGGTFTLSGKAVTTFQVQRLSATFGTFQLLGQPVGIRRSMAATRGLFSLAGQAVSKRQTFRALFGNYSLAGQLVRTADLRRVAAGFGSYSLAGQPAAVRFNFRVHPVGFGGFNLFGQAVALPYAPAARVITASLGSFALDGRAVILARDRVMPVAFGSYSLSGQPVGTRRRWTVTAQFGGYSLAGQAVITWRLKKTTAALGTYQLAGQAVRVARLNIVKAAAGLGSYSLAGQAVIVSRVQRTLAVDPGIYGLSGQAVHLQPNLLSDIMPVGVGAYALAGKAVELRQAAAALAIAEGVYTLTGYNTTLTTRGPREPTKPRAGGAEAGTGERHGSQARNITRRRAA